VGELKFSLRLLPSAGANYDRIAASTELQAELDGIVQSFAWLSAQKPPVLTTAAPSSTPAQPGAWQAYTNRAYGFALEYPSDWQLQEETHLVKLSQGTLTLLIAFKRSSESVNLGPDQVPAGTLENRAAVRFLNQNLPKQSLVLEGKDKAVFYSGTSPFPVSLPGAVENLEFVVILYDFNPDYNAVSIPAAQQAQAERILNTFRAVAVGTPLPGTPGAATSLPSPTAAVAQGTPTWRDTLDNGQYWYMLNTTNTLFEVKDGKLALKAYSPNRLEEWGIANVAPLQNFYLQAAFTTGAACSGYDRYGVIFRAPQPDRGYVLGFSCSGAYRLYKWDGTNFVSLQDWTQATEIKSGAKQTNTLGVLAEGSSIKVYANGSLLATLSDTTFTQGQFGLFVGSAETQNLEIFVDEVAYWLK